MGGESQDNSICCKFYMVTATQQQIHLKRKNKQKQGPLNHWIALNPKCEDLGSSNLTKLFIWSDAQIGEVSAS